VEVPAASATDFAQLVGRRLDPEAVARQIDRARARADGDEPHVLRVVPELAETGDGAPLATTPTVDSAFVAAGLSAARRLAHCRRTAAARMSAETSRSASAEAHDRLRRTETEAGEPAAARAVEREAAMAMGSMAHELLENLDLEGDLAAQVTAVRERIGDGVADDPAADLLQRLADGRCLERLAELAGQVAARELPVLLWEEEPEPGMVVSGFIDLVYRDPDDGRLVVADYKTDRIEGRTARDERTAVYEPQLATYARALRRALDLDYEPRCELWFLHADEIVRLEPGTA
jgi:ATP-dependent exoDNAse (exonuclease V) beta subunit